MKHSRTYLAGSDTNFNRANGKMSRLDRTWRLTLFIHY